jgi:hypothetical protein
MSIRPPSIFEISQNAFGGNVFIESPFRRIVMAPQGPRMRYELRPISPRHRRPRETD